MVQYSFPHPTSELPLNFYYTYWYLLYTALTYISILHGDKKIAILNHKSPTMIRPDTLKNSNLNHVQPYQFNFIHKTDWGWCIIVIDYLPGDIICSAWLLFILAHNTILVLVVNMLSIWLLEKMFSLSAFILICYIKLLSFTLRITVSNIKTWCCDWTRMYYIDKFSVDSLIRLAT